MDNKLKNGLYVRGNALRWYKDGKLHRDDGPAVFIFTNSAFPNPAADSFGNPRAGLSDLEFNKLLENFPKIENIGDVDYSSCLWMKNGIPVFEKLKSYYWYKDDFRHREDGPAGEHHWGKEWFINGERHREDGPARILYDLEDNWFLNGVSHTENQFRQWLAKKDLNENLHSTLEEKLKQKKYKM